MKVLEKTLDPLLLALSLSYVRVIHIYQVLIQINTVHESKLWLFAAGVCDGDSECWMLIDAVLDGIGERCV